MDDASVEQNKRVALNHLSLTGQDAGNYELVNDNLSTTATISPKPVTVSGITVADKEYDGSTAATLVVSNATLSVLEADKNKVTLTVSDGAGTFNDKNAGSNKAVTIDSTKLSLADVNASAPAAANYMLAESGQQDSATGTITQKGIAVRGLKVKNKTYDGTANAEFDLSEVVYSGLVAGDDVYLDPQSGDAAFADANAEVGKNVTITASELLLTGADAGNYSLDTANSTLTGLKGTITQKDVTVSGITVADKEYDGTRDATLVVSTATLTGLLEADQNKVTLTAGQGAGTFADANAGTNKDVTIDPQKLSLADVSSSDPAAGNYKLAETGQQTSAKGTITKKKLTVSGIAAKDKEYDGTTDVLLKHPSALLPMSVNPDEAWQSQLVIPMTAQNGIVNQEQVNMVVTGAFADKKAGNDKTVNLTVSLSSENNGLLNNYAISTQSQNTASASISRKPVTINGITAEPKIYDGTTNVTLNSDSARMDGKVKNDDLFFTVDGVLDSPDAGQGERVSLSNYQLTGSDAGNYQVAENGTQTSAEITVQPRDVTVTPDEISSAVGAPLQKLTFTVSGLVDAADKDSLKVKLSTTADNQKEGKYPITGTQDEGANPNYTVRFREGIQYTVFTSKTEQPVVVASAYSGVYDQKAHSISVKVTDKDADLLKDGLATVYYADKALDASNCQSAGSTVAPAYTDAGAYPVYYCVIFSGTYSSATPVSGCQNVTIEKAPQTAPDAPKVKTKKLESITVEAQEGQEYSIDGKTWQTSGTFKQLRRNRQYKIYARFAESANYHASPSSQPTVLKTKALSSKLQLDKGMKNVQTGNQLDVSWGKVDEATGYLVYAQYCGMDFNKKPDFVADAQDITSVTLTAVNHKKLKLNRCVRVKVVAMKGKKPLCTSIFVHAMGRGKKGFANPVGIELKKDKFTLIKKNKKKKTAKIKAKAVLNRKGRQISDEHTAEFRYASSDNSVATVSEKGVLTAKGKGECFVFVYARSGFARMIRVTVK